MKLIPCFILLELKWYQTFIKKWIDDPNIYLVLSTHKPETLYQLNKYCEFIAKVNDKMDGVEYLDLDHIRDLFNEINQHFLTNFTSIKDNYAFLSKIKVKFSFQLARLFFCINEKIILTEGITDQMFFKNKTSKLVISTFGTYQIALYISLLKWLKGSFEGIFIICDGDGKLSNKKSKNYLLKEKINDFSISNFFFEQDIERNLFSYEKRGRIPTWKKFKLLEKNMIFKLKMMIY